MSRFVRRSSSKLWKTAGISMLLFGTVFALFFWGVNVTGRQTKDEQKRYLEQAVTRCMLQCYATEGHYPESLDYMIEHYGLVYDKESFFVDYRVSGSNLRPEVTVLEYGGAK